MITIDINLGRTKNLRESFVRRVVRAALTAVKLKNASLSIAFVDDKVTRSLNKKWRGLDKVTDVLSFGPGQNFEMPLAAGSDLGEIIIDYEEAARAAKRKKWTFKQETALLIVHGILHCAGYDHETLKQEKEMFALQEKILKKIHN